MAMRNGRAGAYDFTLTLDDPNDLFDPRPSDVLAGLPPRAPGVEQIRDELSVHPLKAPARLAIELPPDKATPGLEHAFRRAIARYCQEGIARAELELRWIHREGIQTLLFGAVVLAVGLALSEAVLRTGSIPKELRDFFGNGLFLVVAWVGLWYPLDTLIYGAQPHRFERKLLRAMREMEIAVRPAGERRDEPREPIATDQSLTGG
jgi:hypothetical protein